MSSVNYDQDSVQKAENAHFSWNIRHGIDLIVAVCCLIAFFLAFLYGRHLGTYTIVFLIATCAAAQMRSLIKGWEIIAGETANENRWPTWSVVTYALIFGLCSNWICAFLWFSRRYAFFSAPVVGVTVLIMASYGAIALLIAFLAFVLGGNWRRTLLVLSATPILVACVILRLRLHA